MMKTSSFLLLVGLIAILLGCAQPVSESQNEPTRSLKRYDRPDASILRGVEIPEGAAFLFTSGLVAPVLNADAPQGSHERYGDTFTQSMGILQRIKELLEEADLNMQDVVFMRIYLVPGSDGKVDWEGWFRAYAEYFNNDENPNKVARTTVAIHSLANPDLLVEIEAIAVYP